MMSQQNIVSIKGTKNGLLILLNSDYHFETIKQELEEKLNASKGFFIGAKFALHSRKDYSLKEHTELTQICCQNGLIPQEDIKKDYLEHKNNRSQSPFPKGLTLEETSGKCLLLRKNIRNGQSIQYEGHVVILGNVHRGAEIIAGG